MNKPSEAIPAMLAYIAGVAIQNGLTDYKQLADAAGLHRQQVSLWMNGRGKPSLENFLKLAAAAGVKIELTGGPYKLKIP